ncbi:aspartyl protease [Ceratobasidium sp. AG-Ba]|nr:aspartyl protease [Ceratobasidium sp. AG-Ba]QRW01961.1 aspartyl protease [Ceratobasidium sp. AG-Ba]
MFFLGFTVLFFGASFVHALRLPASRLSTRGSHKFGNSFSATRPGLSSGLLGTTNAAVTQNNNTDLSSVHDIVYTAFVTIAGTEYSVQIDTGSSDTWVRSDNIALAQVSNIVGNITYGTGWAAGPISRADVSFAGYNVSSQAFMMATSSNNPILEWGAQGLVGLGVNSLSTIDQLVNSTGSSWGRSLLYNIFAQSPTTPNFIAFLLQRSGDAASLSSEGSFAVGELEPEYEAAITATEAIPTWPLVGSKRWTILVDGYDTTGAILHSLSSAVPGVPRGKAVALIDSGTTYAYASQEFCKNLYSGIPGASYSSVLGQWVVPCNQEVDIGLSIGGRRFPVHPMDTTSPSLTSPDNSTCYGTFIPQTFSVSEGQFDMILGDVFLRNVYAMFDLGDWENGQLDSMGSPYVKLLSVTNATTASAEFHQLRGGAPTDANKISNAQSSTSSFSPSSSTVSVGEDKLDHLARFAEIMLSLLAVNTLLLVIGVGVLVYFVFFRRRRARSSGPASDTGAFPFDLGHLRPPGAAYQPVPSARNSVVP